MPTETVYIGIGSNLGDSIDIVQQAITCIGQITGTELTAQSSLYRSEAVSDIVQGDYINAVVEVQTSFQPMGLLLELQAIEYAFYRQRDNDVRWAPRTLDLDIILFGKRNIEDSHLTIPHPEMTNRLFVLLPLQEINHDLEITELGSLNDLLNLAPAINIRKITN